ncbi:MAG: biopolymer transporter ExbD [Holophagaceae bacterium]|nr:biopolymer transporter ExbD [Holophagaceae bacterium]
MDAGGAKGKAKSDINVTPLIDIVLVLLIVFIVMVPGLTKAQNVTVPQVVVAPPPTTPPLNPPLVISIDKDGNYMLQSDKVQLEEMAEKVQAAAGLQERGSRKVYLKVDEEMAFGKAVDAMDQIRLAGDRLKVESVKKFSDGNDGGDIKVSISIKRRA